MRLAALALVLTTAVAAFAAAPGSTAPAFSLPSAAGATVSLASHTGKWVVLEWVNFDCPFVVKHYASGNLPKLQADAASKGIIWLSICSSSVGKQGNFAGQALTDRIAKERAVPAAYLIDESGTVGRAYEAKTTPTICLIDPAGVVRYFGALDSIASTAAADIPKATNHLTAALEEALAGKPITTALTTAYGCGVKYAAQKP